jgi:hypothetical protein
MANRSHRPRAMAEAVVTTAFVAGRHRWKCVPLTASPSSLVKGTKGTGLPL